MTELLSAELPPERIFTIYNGLDFSDDGKTYEGRPTCKLGIDAGGCVVAA